MTLEDVQGFTAVDNLVSLLDNQTFHALVPWKYTVPNAKIFSIPDPSIKAVSLISDSSMFFILKFFIF